MQFFKLEEKATEKPYPDVSLSNFGKEDCCFCASTEEAWIEKHCKRIRAGHYTSVAFHTITGDDGRRQEFSKKMYDCILETLITQPHALRKIHFVGHDDQATINFVNDRLIPAIRTNPCQIEEVKLTYRALPKTWENPAEEAQPAAASACVLL